MTMERIIYLIVVAIIIIVLLRFLFGVGDDDARDLMEMVVARVGPRTGFN